MTPAPASDPRRAFTLDTMTDELRAGLLALADQYEAEAGQGEHDGALAFPAPDADALRPNP